MKSLLCLFGFHKYRADHKVIEQYEITFWNGQKAPFETILLGDSKCVRCGKKFRPKWAVNMDKEK